MSFYRDLHSQTVSPLLSLPNIHACIFPLSLKPPSPFWVCHPIHRHIVTLIPPVYWCIIIITNNACITLYITPMASPSYLSLYISMLSPHPIYNPLCHPICLYLSYHHHLMFLWMYNVTTHNDFSVTWPRCLPAPCMTPLCHPMWLPLTYLSPHVYVGVTTHGDFSVTWPRCLPAPCMTPCVTLCDFPLTYPSPHVYVGVTTHGDFSVTWPRCLPAPCMTPCVTLCDFPLTYPSPHVYVGVTTHGDFSVLTHRFGLHFASRFAGPTEARAVATAAGGDWGHDGLMAHHSTQVTLNR